MLVHRGSTRTILFKVTLTVRLWPLIHLDGGWQCRTQDRVRHRQGLESPMERPTCTKNFATRLNITSALTQRVRLHDVRTWLFRGFRSRVGWLVDWVSSLLVVTRPPSEADGETKIRICLDPRYLNVAIKREHFPMPTTEEINQTKWSKAN